MTEQPPPPTGEPEKLPAPPQASAQVPESPARETPAADTFKERWAAMDQKPQVSTMRTFGCPGTIAKPDDHEDAYYACVNIISDDINAAVSGGRFPDPGTATDSGRDGNWVITGTHTGVGAIFYTCNASRVGQGKYRITWSPNK